MMIPPSAAPLAGATNETRLFNTSEVLRLAKSDRTLFVLPLLFALAKIAIALAGGLVLLIAWVGHGSAVAPLIMLLMGIGLAVVSTLGEAALLVAARAVIAGRPVSATASLRAVGSRLTGLAALGLINYTIGQVLHALERRGVIGWLLSSLFGVAWFLASYLALPALLFEQLGPIDAIRRSLAMLRALVGPDMRRATFQNLLRLGGAYLLVSVGGLILAGLFAVMGVIALFSGHFGLGAVLLVIAIIVAAIRGLLVGAVSAVAKVLVYRLAAEGRAGPGLARTV